MNRNELINIIVDSVIDSSKKSISVIMGHGPMMYDGNTMSFGIEAWERFPIYTWDLGCAVIAQLRTKSIDAKIFLLADDKDSIIAHASHYKMPTHKTIRRLKSEFYSTNILPQQYDNILHQYGLHQGYIARHDHKKHNRNNSLIFSENILERDSKWEGENYCAKAYISLLDQHIDVDNTYVVSFIPMRCANNICNIALSETSSDVRGIHLFLYTNSNTNKEDMLHTCFYKKH